MGPFFNLDPDRKLTKDHDIQMVQRGQMFIKYGRRGRPHARFVYISSDEKYLVWCVKALQIVTSADPSVNSATTRSGKAQGATTPGKETQIKRIQLDDITDIKVGVNSTSVLKRHSLPQELDNVCMSVITGSRTLDLKANDSQTRNKWVQYFYDRVLKEKLEQMERPSVAASQLGKKASGGVARGPDSELLRKHNVSLRYSAYQQACNDDE